MQKEEKDINDVEMTPEMKYIKWPKFGKAVSELASVVLGTVVIAMFIAASDEIGKMIIRLFM